MRRKRISLLSTVGSTISTLCNSESRFNAFASEYIERLYRLRYLHRGTHAARTAVEFVHALWLSLSRPTYADMS